MVHVAAQDLLTLSCVHESAIGRVGTQLDYLIQGIPLTLLCKRPRW
jgi:hypothetical protein